MESKVLTLSFPRTQAGLWTVDRYGLLGELCTGIDEERDTSGISKSAGVSTYQQSVYLQQREDPDPVIKNVWELT